MAEQATHTEWEIKQVASEAITTETINKIGERLCSLSNDAEHGFAELKAIAVKLVEERDRARSQFGRADRERLEIIRVLTEMLDRAGVSNAYPGVAWRVEDALADRDRLSDGMVEIVKLSEQYKLERDAAIKAKDACQAVSQNLSEVTQRTHDILSEVVAPDASLADKARQIVGAFQMAQDALTKLQAMDGACHLKFLPKYEAIIHLELPEKIDHILGELHTERAALAEVVKANERCKLERDANQAECTRLRVELCKALERAAMATVDLEKVKAESVELARLLHSNSVMSDCHQSHDYIDRALPITFHPGCSLNNKVAWLLSDWGGLRRKVEELTIAGAESKENLRKQVRELRKDIRLERKAQAELKDLKAKMAGEAWRIQQEAFSSVADMQRERAGQLKRVHELAAEREQLMAEREVLIRERDAVIDYRIEQRDKLIAERDKWIADFREVTARATRLQGELDRAVEVRKSAEDQNVKLIAASCEHRERLKSIEAAFIAANDIAIQGNDRPGLLQAIANILNEIGCESEAASALVCPWEEPMHFHHDGCPSCAEVEAWAEEIADEILRTETTERLRTAVRIIFRHLSERAVWRKSTDHRVNIPNAIEQPATFNPSPREPCHDCDGRGSNDGGETDCGRCDGKGVEQPEIDAPWYPDGIREGSAAGLTEDRVREIVHEVCNMRNKIRGERIHQAGYKMDAPSEISMQDITLEDTKT